MTAVRAAWLTVLLVLALAAPAGAAPSLVTLGSFTSPTWAGSPTGDTRRVFVTERVGRVRVIVDGVVQVTPFLDLTGITLATSQERGLLSLAFAPDYATSGRFYVYLTAQSPAGRDPDPRVQAVGDQHEPRRPAQRPTPARDHAQPGLEPQRRPSPDRTGREAVAGDRRRRRLEQPVRARAEPELAAGKAAAAGSRRRDAGDARGRPAQSVAVLVHAGRADRHRRRRPEPVRGDQRRAGRELRLAVPRGAARLPVRPGLQRRRHARPGPGEDPRRPGVLLDHRRLRRARPGTADARGEIHLRRLLQRRPAVRACCRAGRATPPSA